MQKQTRFISLLAALMCTLCAAPLVQAQQQLTLNSTVEGSADAGSVQSWSFSAQSGQILSFLAVSTTGEFDPTLTITDRAGNTLISNDDYAYPETRDSLLEAITVPRTDTYTATVTGFNDTAGGYRLSMLSGFAQTAEAAGISDDADWQPYENSLDAEIADDQLTLRANGGNQRGIAYADLPSLADFAARVVVQNVRNAAGWTVGITARGSDDTYYLYEVNNAGLWRFSLVQDGTMTVLRDWINHPNIVPGKESFSLTLMVRGAGFDFYYDDGFVGTASDTTITEAGQVGLSVGTVNAQASETTAVFSDLVLTTPLQVDGQPIIPNELILGDGPVMAQTLHQRHLVAANGVLSLTVPESSVQYARPGVQRLMLGRGVSYTNFALGATIEIEPSIAGPVGCGLVFRYASEADYTLAFLDATGGYGVSRRDGEDFQPGLFGENTAFAGVGEHHLLVIAAEDTVYYYVDGSYVGSADNTAQAGQVGGAVVNFEGITNTCTFTNLWLWSWGE